MTGEVSLDAVERRNPLRACLVQRLLDALNRLVDAGRAVLMIGHYMDVAKMADYVVDLGP